METINGGQIQPAGLVLGGSSRGFTAGGLAGVGPVALSGESRRVPGGVVTSIETGGGTAAAVELPAAWAAVALPASGYIGPVSAQLAMVRGALAVYDGGGLLVGGARLIGPAGKVFSFSTAGAADMWAAINKARGVREAELLAGMDAAAAVVYRARKAEALEKVAAAVVNAAGKVADAAIKAALLAESNFLLMKWA